MKTIFNELEELIATRKRWPKPDSYTSRLFSEENLILRKLSEETYEVIEAAFKGDREAIVNESCDLFYHFLVMLRKYEISLIEIEEELRRRRQL